MAAWYFLVLNGGGSAARIGPFTNQIKCDTYRMRIARSRATSGCVVRTAQSSRTPARHAPSLPGQK